MPFSGTLHASITCVSIPEGFWERAWLVRTSFLSAKISYPYVLAPGGESEEEKIRVDMLENQVMDFRMSLVMVCYNPDFVSLPASVIYLWSLAVAEEVMLYRVCKKRGHPVCNKHWLKSIP